MPLFQFVRMKLEIRKLNKLNNQPSSTLTGTSFLSAHLVFSIILSLLLFGVLSIAQGQSFSEKKIEFTWDENQKYQTLDKVRFANGDLIEVAEGNASILNLKEICTLRRLEVRREAPKSLLFVTNACDSIVQIRAAYPDIRNAKLAVVTTNCGGTTCHSFNDHFIVFISDSGLRIARVGTSFIGPKNKSTKYEFGFDGQRLSNALVSNFYDGSENEFGDLLASTRVFIKQGDFVDVRFNKEFLKFVGEHPDVVMGDSDARALLISKIKAERFKAFRSAMSGPGSSSVYNGRFLVMNACMKSNCPFVFGSVVLDGFTGSIHLLRFSLDENIFDHASSQSINEKIDANWLDAIDTQGRYRLLIKQRRLRAEKIYVDKKLP